MPNDAVSLAIRCLDLTSLTGDESAAQIDALCSRALLHDVASVCVFPQFIAQAKNHGCRVTTVAAGFPTGQIALQEAVDQVKQAVELGADEIDIVFPRRLANDRDADGLAAWISACRAACPNQTLKVILGVGELTDLDVVRFASEVACECGADFIKTSTGKEAINATPETFTVMADVVHRFYEKTGKRVGLKAAGGVRTAEQCLQYLTLAGEGWQDPKSFRIGASGALDALLGAEPATNSNY